MMNQFFLLCLLVVTWSHALLANIADVSGESEESIESTEEPILSARSPASGVMQQVAPPATFNKTKFNNVNNQTSNNKVVKPIFHQLQPPAVRPYFYPGMIPPYVLRASPYQAAYYHPILMPVMSPLYPASSPNVRNEMLTGRRPFPVDDEISEEEALKELEAIKKEMAEDAAAQRHLDRLVLPSISVNHEESSVTVSLKSFASLLRNLSSRVTVTLATRTILVPNVSVNH